MDCSPPGFSVHGILQAKIWEWVANPLSQGSSQPRGKTQVSCTEGRFFTIWATNQHYWDAIYKQWKAYIWNINLVSFEKYINLNNHQQNQDKKYFPSSQKIPISFSTQFLPPKATATLNSVSTEYLACCFACHPFYINEII